MIEAKLLLSFSTDQTETQWSTIDDRVMGGISRSTFSCTDHNTAVFSGIVSLENNGGFASVSSAPEILNLGIFSGIVLRAKGDGKRYKLRLRTDPRFGGINYEQPFETNGMWQEKYLPFEKYYPTRRGRVLHDASPLDSAKVHTFGLIISEKQAGPFRLEVEWIKAYRD